MNVQSANINLETFAIRTPPDGGDYQLSLGDKMVSAKTLKYGVVKLFNLAGVMSSGTAGVEYQLLDIIKEAPPSRQKDWLLSILCNLIPEISPAIPPEGYQSTSNQQESPSSPPPDRESPMPSVTVQSPPIRIPYRRRGQATIYDSIVNKAIAAGGSLRGIKSSLESQGIIISHMTLSRRKKEIIQ